MADPTVKKISELTAATTLAADDLVIVVDVDEPIAANKTKKATTSLLTVYSADQLGSAVVTNAKLGPDAVNGDKIADDSIDSEHYVDGSIDTAHIGDLQVTNAKLAVGAAIANLADLAITTAKLANNAVTEAKLGTIKRTVIFRITGPTDDVEVENYGNFTPWPVTLHGFVVIDARINLTEPSTNGFTTVEITNQGGLMTTLSLGYGATGMGSSGSINSSYRTAITNQFLSVNVTAAGVSTKGLTLTLVLEGIPS